MLDMNGADIIPPEFRKWWNQRSYASKQGWSSIIVGNAQQCQANYITPYIKSVWWMEFFLSSFVPIVFCSITLGAVHLSPSDKKWLKSLAYLNHKVAAGDLGVILTGHMSFRPRSVQGFKSHRFRPCENQVELSSPSKGIFFFVHRYYSCLHPRKGQQKYQVVQVCGCHVIRGELCAP
jgi:hypothetical protein